MQNSNLTDAEDLRIFQIIDANLDRAREGLRVLEDWARFGLGENDCVKRIKNFRQILGRNHLEAYKQSRNYIEDKCKGLTHQEQSNRKTPEQIIKSNAGRARERALKDTRRKEVVDDNQSPSCVSGFLFNMVDYLF